MKKYLPFSLGLFLTGVFLCFFFVLPITLTFPAPVQRLARGRADASAERMDGLRHDPAADLRPRFQTPLVMLFLERISIFTVDDFRAKRKFAILIITVAAAVLTPGQDPFSMLLLAVPMILLYELGILLIGRNKRLAVGAADRDFGSDRNRRRFGMMRRSS